MIQLIVGHELRRQSGGNRIRGIRPLHREHVPGPMSDVLGFPRRADETGEAGPGPLGGLVPSPALARLESEKRAVARLVEGDQTLSGPDKVLHRGLGGRAPARAVVVDDQRIVARQRRGGEPARLFQNVQVEDSRPIQDLTNRRRVAAPVVVRQVALPGDNQDLQWPRWGSPGQARRQSDNAICKRDSVSHDCAFTSVSNSRTQARLRSIIGPPCPSHSRLRTPS